MALSAMEAAFSILSSNPSASSVSNSLHNPIPLARFGISSSPFISLKSPLYTIPLRPSLYPIKKIGFDLHAAVETVSLEENVEKSRQVEGRRKLFVLNLPWSSSVADIKNIFSQCGTVADVEIIKKDGKNRGFAFVTMASPAEAQTAIEKLDSFEVGGRIIRVQFAKRFKRPPRAVPASPPPGETRHKLYVSNLAWKVRSNNLRDFFSPNFNPVSVRVVFENPSGRSAGYGFVSFETKEEADSAISEFDGKELLGRPIRLKFSEKNTDTSESKEESTEEQPEEP